MQRVVVFYRAACLAAICAGFSGCASSAVSHGVGEALANEVIGQAADLTVPAVKFRSENGRWPEDLSELAAFVQQSGGRLRSYDQVEFTRLPGDSFEILAVGSDGTNRATMTYHQNPSVVP